MHFIELIEKYFNKEFKKVFVPLQVGDVENTFCDTSILCSDYGYIPQISVEKGIKNFLDWYVDYYKVNSRI